jgi:hypothetical protein
MGNAMAQESPVDSRMVARKDPVGTETGMEGSFMFYKKSTQV